MGLINLHVVCELLAHKAKGVFFDWFFHCHGKTSCHNNEKILFCKGLLNDTILLSLSH